MCTCIRILALLNLFYTPTTPLHHLLQNSESVMATSLMYADVVWSRVAQDRDELGFTVGDEVQVLDMTDDMWWYGSVQDTVGWFPASFVRVTKLPCM